MPRTIFILLIFWAFSPRSHAQFTEVSSSAGIDFAPVPLFNLGGGLAWFDYDNDGWEDLYITGCTNMDRLYKNNGDGTFTDVSLDAGLPVTVLANTVCVTTGDIDNDGDRDVFLGTWRTTGSSNFAPNMLLRNNGDGTFTEVAEDIGLPEPTYGTGATFFDANKDGWLDLYVACYIQSVQLTVDPETQQVVGFSHDCFQDNFYLNNGDGTFVNMTQDWNAINNGCALGVVASDKDGDGDTDILVANDFGEFIEPNIVLQNEFPSLEFTEVAETSSADIAMYGMGVAVGDYDEDLDLDYYITNLGRNVLLNNNGAGQFQDLTTEADVENATSNGLYNTSWGTTFLDVDNDGYLDLFVANGHLPTVPFIQNNLLDPNKLYRNLGDGTFEDETEAQQLGSTLMARGCGYADYDKDGDLDLAVVNLEQGEFAAENKVELFQNPGNENHSIQFELQGTLSSKDAFGAWVIVHAGGRQLLREIGGGSSHASQNTSRVHVGVGEFIEVDSVKVIWPVGIPETWYYLEADSLHTLEQGTTIDIPSYSLPKLKIFPNPASSVAYISGLSNDAELHGVSDLHGRSIDGFWRVEGGTTWELSWPSEIAPGTYIVRVEQAGITQSFRLLIE